MGIDDKDKDTDGRHHHHHDHNRWRGRNASGDAVYGFGLIGALIYYIGHATSFWAGVLGVLKSIIWPVIFVYKALELFK